MEKILVTGGFELLGYHLYEKLLNVVNKVICLDNFFTGKKNSVIQLFKNPYLKLIKYNVTMPFFIEVDETYNLACSDLHIHYQNN